MIRFSYDPHNEPGETIEIHIDLAWDVDYAHRLVDRINTLIRTRREATG